MTSDTFCHWKPLLQKVGAVVILFLVDLFLAVGADGKVLIALTTGRQVLRKMLLSWECSATLPLCTKRAMSRVPGPSEAVLRAWMSV